MYDVHVFPCIQLLLGAGLIRQSSAGVYHLLPLGMRVFERLTAIVDYHMQAVGGSKMALPILTPATQWKTSGVVLYTSSMLYNTPSHEIVWCVLVFVCCVCRSLGLSGV